METCTKEKYNKVSRRVTEYTCFNEGKESGTVRMQGGQLNGENAKRVGYTCVQLSIVTERAGLTRPALVS